MEAINPCKVINLTVLENKILADVWRNLLQRAMHIISLAHRRTLVSWCITFVFFFREPLLLILLHLEMIWNFESKF